MPTRKKFLTIDDINILICTLRHNLSNRYTLTTLKKIAIGKVDLLPIPSLFIEEMQLHIPEQDRNGNLVLNEEGDACFQTITIFKFCTTRAEQTLTDDSKLIYFFHHPHLLLHLLEPSAELTASLLFIIRKLSLKLLEKKLYEISADLSDEGIIRKSSSEYTINLGHLHMAQNALSRDLKTFPSFSRTPFCWLAFFSFALFIATILLSRQFILTKGKSVEIITEEISQPVLYGVSALISLLLSSLAIFLACRRDLLQRTLVSRKTLDLMIEKMLVETISISGPLLPESERKAEPTPPLDESHSSALPISAVVTTRSVDSRLGAGTGLIPPPRRSSRASLSRAATQLRSAALPAQADTTTIFIDNPLSSQARSQSLPDLAALGSRATDLSSLPSDQRREPTAASARSASGRVASQSEMRLFRPPRPPRSSTTTQSTVPSLLEEVANYGSTARRYSAGSLTAAGSSAAVPRDYHCLIESTPASARSSSLNP